MPYRQTVPAVSGEDDHKNWREAKYSQRANDSRTNTIIGVCLAALLSLMTIAMCWLASTVVTYGQDLVGVKASIAILINRPDGISRQEYGRDSQRWDNEINRLSQEQRERQRGH